MEFILVRDPGLTAGGGVGALDGAQVVCASNKIRGTAWLLVQADLRPKEGAQVLLTRLHKVHIAGAMKGGGGAGEIWVHYLKKGLISEISRWYWIVTMKSSPRTVTRYRISISSNILTRLIYRT